MEYSTQSSTRPQQDCITIVHEIYTPKIKVDEMNIRVGVACDNSSTLSEADLRIIRDHVPITHPALLYTDYVCVTFFLVEIILRVLTVPNKKVFIRQPLNIIDIVCLIPHVVSIILKSFFPYADTAALIKSVMILRIIRILRLFKLMKHYTAFKILLYTIKVSTRELMLVIIFLLLGVLIFGSIMHFVDQENFPNIPIGVWWAVVTMTTVGYGDITPSGISGYLIGTVCVVCGVLVIAFTVPIVVNNFSMFYSYAQSRGKLPHGRGICKLKRAYAGGKLKQSLLQIAACEKLKHVKSSRNAPKDSTVVDIQTGSMVFDRDASQFNVSNTASETKTHKLSELTWLSRETSKIMKKMSGRDEHLQTERQRQTNSAYERRERKRNSVSAAGGDSSVRGVCRNECAADCRHDNVNAGATAAMFRTTNAGSVATPTTLGNEDIFVVKQNGSDRRYSQNGGDTEFRGQIKDYNDTHVIAYNCREAQQTMDYSIPRIDVVSPDLGLRRELLKPPQRIRKPRHPMDIATPVTSREVVVKHK